MPSNVAEIMEVPAAIAVANPCDPEALEIVATVVSDDAHVACVVTSCVDSSEYIAIAMNCWVCPATTLGKVGMIMIISRTTGVTVSTVEPTTPAIVALIVDVPVLTAVATPTVGAAFEMVATEVALEAQVT